MPLHIANGHSTTGLIERSGLSGRTGIWADPLNEGPVPGGVSDDELLAARARFLAPTPDQAPKIEGDLQGWRDAVDREDDYDELVLWFEHDLFDQLNLIQLLTFIGRRPRVKPVSVICIGSYPGRPGFKGLGELAPAEIALLFAARVPVTPDQITVAARAWAAYRSDDPRAIESLLAGDTSPLPFLAAALARHLEEFPSAVDGVSRTERRLMEQASGGPAELRTAFPKMHAGETAYYVADSWFVDRANALASCAPPLVTLQAAAGSQASPLNATVTLTAAGREVLDRKADRVARSGIDRWLGGVHLCGNGPVWRWSEIGQRLIYA